MVMAPPPRCDSAVLPCLQAAWLSSRGISHHSLLPHLPSICLSAVNRSPHTRIAPQSLNSSSQPLPLPGDLRFCLAYVWLRQWLSDSHSIYSHSILYSIPFSFHSHFHCRSAVSLSSLKCFSCDSDSWPSVGIRPLLQFPHPPRAGPVLLTLLCFPLVPSSYRVLCGSIDSFPLVMYSCPLSAGIPHALLCLKV